MSKIIKPTVGRIVYFYEAKSGPYDNGPTVKVTGPLAARVTAVHGDTCINVAIDNANGSGSFGRTSIRLLHPGEHRPTLGEWCEWMPYQIEQANQAEAIRDGARSLIDSGKAIDPNRSLGEAIAEPNTRHSAGQAIPPGPPRVYADSAQANVGRASSSPESVLLNRLRCVVDALTDGMPHKRAMAELDTIVNGGNS